MSMYQYLKDYFTNTREPSNVKIVGDPSSIHQRVIMKERSKTSFNTRKKSNRCQPCGCLEARVEANRYMEARITKRVEDILNSRMTKMESDISYLLQNAKSQINP